MIVNTKHVVFSLCSPVSIDDDATTVDDEGYPNLEVLREDRWLLLLLARTPGKETGKRPACYLEKNGCKCVACFQISI